MKDLWIVFKDGLISGASMFSAIAITTITFLVFVVIWVLAYLVCWVMFVFTELIDARFGVDDWHPDAQLSGFEPYMWPSMIHHSYSYWHHAIYSHIENILK